MGMGLIAVRDGLCSQTKVLIPACLGKGLGRVILGQKKPALVGGSFRKKVRRLGFEPRTNWLKANCSTN